MELDGRPVLRLVQGTPQPSNLHLDPVCALDEFTGEVERLHDLGATRIGPHHSVHWGESQIFAGRGGGIFCLNADSS